MNQIIAISLFAVLLLTSSAHTSTERQPVEQAQVQQKGTINWVTWDEAMRLFQQEKKKIVVSVHRKNCNWCKKMDSETFENPQIANYINKHFYAVKFDADHSKEVEKGEKTYKAVRKSGKTVHEFTAYLTMGQMSTPTTVFFNEQLELLQPLPGYKKTELFEIILTYFGGDHYLRVPWSRYKAEYEHMAD